MIRTEGETVLTVPISPPRRHNPGILALCNMADILRAKTGGEGHLCLNLNDGFHNRPALMSSFQTCLTGLGLNELRHWSDSYDESHVRRNLDLLTACGLVHETDVEKLLCDCSRIDCKADTADQIHKGKLLQHEGSDLTCRFCKTAARLETVPALVFRVPEQAPPLLTVPDYLGRELASMHRHFAGQGVLISKQRQTGMSHLHHGQNYNIDVDFRTFNFLSALPGKDRIVLATSHVSYQIYMMNMMARLCEPEKNTVFLPIAHINGDCPVDLLNPNWSTHNKRLYLASAFNPAKETRWPQQAATYVRQHPTSLLSDVYDQLMAPSHRRETENLPEYVGRLIRKEIWVPALIQRLTQKTRRGHTGPD